MLSTIPQGITESRDTEPGKYLWQIQTFEEKNQEGSGRLFLNTQLRCVMPENRLGRFHFESFWIGTDEDPPADQAATWLDSMGASRLKSFCKAAGVPFDGQDPKVVFASLVNRQVGGHVERVLNKKDNKHYTNVTKWYAPGTFEPVIEIPTADLAPPPVASPTVAPPATQGTVPQGLPAGQAGLQPGYMIDQVPPPAQVQAHAAVQAQPVVQGGVSQQPGYVPPMATPQAAAIPGAQGAPQVAQPQVQPSVPQVAPVAPVQPAGNTIACAVCVEQNKPNVQVLESEMDAHVNLHATGAI